MTQITPHASVRRNQRHLRAIFSCKPQNPLELEEFRSSSIPQSAIRNPQSTIGGDVMAGFLVRAGTTVICAHGGQAKATMPNPRVKVMGQPVVTQPPPYVVSGCANPPPPANVGPCMTATWLMGSLRIKVMGQPILLQDSQAICVPTGTPLTIIPTQMRVKGM